MRCGGKVDMRCDVVKRWGEVRSEVKQDKL